MNTNRSLVTHQREILRPIYTLLIAMAFVFLAKPASADGIDPTKYDHPVKLACCGDSITQGQGTTDPAKFGYPTQLQEILGDKWEVKNFGVGGRTLLRKQDPYAFSPAFKFQPDVMVICLGTNDSRQTTWDAHGADFVGDYKMLIEKAKALPSHPIIFICIPPPMFPGNHGLTDDSLTANVIPAIKQVADEEKVDLIDLHTAMADSAKEFADKVHPNVDGAKHIAEIVSKALAAAPTTAPSN